MRTFLLTWNPNQWPWDDLHDSIARVATLGYADYRWSCGNRRDIDFGDRIFLIRLGSDPRGIVASGFVTSPAFDGPHWDKQRSAKGDKTIYVNVRFDLIAEIPSIQITELNEPPFNTVHWHSQSSGVLIPTDVAKAVEQLWNSRIAFHQCRLPEELASCPIYIEGLGRQVVVNAYERNAAARTKCLEHHGYICSCCDTVLSNVYGPIANEFIHVHHLVPLTDIRQSYVVDPKTDLIPVCPTCHAVIHLRNPPLTVEEVRELLASYAATNAT